MVFFNYATMQMAAKIVYYGPGLCGKTTNLHWIYAKTAPQSRGEMVSLETETDRTLFFDLLPLDVGVIGGFKTRLQLYTVPGQVFYNTTRKLVLKGVDGIVFVADSQKAMFDANIESFNNLRENLAEMGVDLDEIPLVVQLNKRDLPNVVDRDSLIKAMNPKGVFEAVEASAVNGTGVFETLKAISKITLRSLRKRMSGDEPARKPVGISSGRQPKLTAETPVAAAPAPRQDPEPPPAAKAPPPPPPPTPPQPAARARTGAATVPVPVLRDTPEPPQAASATPAAETAPPPAVTPAPAATPPPTPQPVTPAQEVPSEAISTDEIKFSEADKEEKVEKVEKEVKHVKVRSSVDIMAELESLRKKATQAPAKAKKEPPAISIPFLSTPAPAAPARGELLKSFAAETAPGTLERATMVRVTVAFEDSQQGVIQTQDHYAELAVTDDIRTLLLNLKINLNR